MSAPIPLSQLDRVEQKYNLYLNVYGWKDGGVVIHRLSKAEVDGSFDLFLVTKGVQHLYTWVKDLNRLLYDQTAYTSASISASAAHTASPEMTRWGSTSQTIEASSRP